MASVREAEGGISRSVSPGIGGASVFRTLFGVVNGERMGDGMARSRTLYFTRPGRIIGGGAGHTGERQGQADPREIDLNIRGRGVLTYPAPCPILIVSPVEAAPNQQRSNVTRTSEQPARAARLHGNDNGIRETNVTTARRAGDGPSLSPTRKRPRESQTWTTEGTASSWGTNDRSGQRTGDYTCDVSPVPCPSTSRRMC